MPSGKEQKLVYAIFRLDDPNIPDLDILHQCLERISVGAVGIVSNPQYLADWGAEHPDEVILQVYSTDRSDEEVMAAAAAYIQRQIDNWAEDMSMSAWYRYDQWARLKNFGHMD
ncbi:uncharacterized protein ACLA_006610 [Aspergillus clavatus NRRL 1]|uniref:Uncharacterized protein n=1 Tax=Aspergillus clavatus (strain ATCC 1007 / CBS 513.65 / DSM 816 / NCTC 3887 / NRRL 1 / QM 1276 / 107) TaxID=344612 RepID=A1CDH6_ASPCL|nr:uncharacterized protein ACLA_006610 [Aspergillus clavatus NRRL 1]EAW11903.1 hypothetical protein ACLA_006610 [Aspergillus clavatus NRRL 1]